MLWSLGSEGGWRRNYHTFMNGNLYPTHGLGPVAQDLGVGRGDAFKFVVSVSSPEFNLSQYRDKKQPNQGRHKSEKYVCGDMNTSIIKTQLGRTIMVQHDVVSLKGMKLTSHEWIEREKIAAFMQANPHPLVQKVGEQAKKVGGHGGMDYVMAYRLLDCIRQGITPDITVYQAADWSSILELSVRSVSDGSMPIQCPDFTRGGWKGLAPLGIVS